MFTCPIRWNKISNIVVPTNSKKWYSGIDHYVNRRPLCPSSVSVSRQPTAFCQGKFFIRFKTLLAISIDTKSAWQTISDCPQDVYVYVDFLIVPIQGRIHKWKSFCVFIRLTAFLDRKKAKTKSVFFWKKVRLTKNYHFLTSPLSFIQ